MISISSEHAGLQPYWKRVEDELYKLADRYKEDARKLSHALEYVAFSIGRQ